MARPGQRGQSSRGEIDPGESVEPRSRTPEVSGFDAHIWASLNQIFEKLGNLDQKVDQLTQSQRDLRGSVERHDKLILRAIYTIGGAVAVIGLLWLLYVNILKDHITIS